MKILIFRKIFLLLYKQSSHEKKIFKKAGDTVFVNGMF